MGQGYVCEHVYKGGSGEVRKGKGWREQEGGRKALCFEKELGWQLGRD